MSSDTRNSESNVPLTPAMFHVLLALAGDDLHGYAILKDVAARTGGEVQLSTGTLYGIIKRLLNDGLIAELRQRPAAAEDDERRRYYRLTAQGREVAAAEAERLEKVVALARSRNLLRKLRTA
jgi:DNA-binding PadR family transcriptional regulator